MNRNSVYLETYGCQMNEYDSSMLSALLKNNKFVQVFKPENAGIILLNTCAVRENAHQKIYAKIQQYSSFKRKNKEVLIGILGCMAQNLGDDLFALGLPVDMVVGPDGYRELPEIIETIQNGKGNNILSTRLSAIETYEEIETASVHGILAYVTVMRGCNKFCAYCVVPYTRGRERSISPESIIEEINRLIKNYNIKEVTLLGQNVNSYRYEVRDDVKLKREPIDFSDLLSIILEKTSIERIRFTSPHPHDFPIKLLDLMAAEKRLCLHIHLPLQSGSNNVLTNMRRNYTREQYIELVKLIRYKLGSDVGITTDLIVGFPGETDKDFDETISLVKDIKYNSAYMFRYSEREGTIAQKNLTDNIPEEIKLKRLQILIDTQIEISKELNNEKVGKEYDVLVEGKSRRATNQMMGRTSQNQVVIISFPENEAGESNFEVYIGKIVQVKILSSSSATLKGLFVQEIS